MADNTIILSIHPHHALNILNGIKTVELRRIPPKIGENDLVLMYATSPIKAIIGAFMIEKTLIQPPEKLWELVGERAAITKREFEDYFKSASLGVALFFHEVWKMREPIELNTLREWWPGFHPPLVHRYLNGDKRKHYILQKLEK